MKTVKKMKMMMKEKMMTIMIMTIKKLKMILKSILMKKNKTLMIVI